MSETIELGTGASPAKRIHRTVEEKRRIVEPHNGEGNAEERLQAIGVALKIRNRLLNDGFFCTVLFLGL